MPSDNIVRSYIQGNIINGQLFDDRYVDKMETGIEDSFKYSNYLEAKMLPQMGVLDKNIDLNNFKAPGVYELNGASNANLPFTPVHGSLFVLAGPHQVQMVVGSEAQNKTSKAYFRRFLTATSTFSDWTTFDVKGSADKALEEAKSYTDTEVGNLGAATDNQIKAINNKIATTRTELINYTDTEVGKLRNTTNSQIQGVNDKIDSTKTELITYTDTAEQDAKNYADNAANKVKNDLLNGAGDAYDTLKELGNLIDENADAIDALETIASGKAPINHASPNTAYGVGTSNYYGHLKLSDSIESTSDVSGGIAATPKAVKDVYDQAVYMATGVSESSIASIKSNPEKDSTVYYIYGNPEYKDTFITRDTLYEMDAIVYEDAITLELKSSYENSDDFGIYIPAASYDEAGVMSASDRKKLDSIEYAATRSKAGKGLVERKETGITYFDINTNFNTAGSNYKVNVDNITDGLYVNVPWTDTKVTSSTNHYTPSGSQMSSAGQTAPGSVSWNSTQVVTGLSWKHDGKGHITAITLDKATMPANPNTNTTYTLSGKADGNTWVTTLTPSSGSASYSTVPAASTTAAGLMTPAMVQKLNGATSNTGTLTGITAGDGLSGGGTSGAVTLAVQTDRGISIVSDKVGHSNSVTAATASEGGNTRTLSFGGSFNIPSITYDAYGHVTSKGSTTLTLPANPDTGATSVTVNGAGNAITSASYDAATRTITLTKGATYSNNSGDITGVTAGNGLTGGGASGSVTLNVGAGSGISVTADAISVNTSYTTSGKNYKVSVDSSSGGLYVNVPWTDNNTWKANSSSSEGYVASGSGQANKVWKTDANGTPAWRDDSNTTYIAATQSAAGLMSAADKAKLDGIASGATANTGDITGVTAGVGLAGGATSGNATVKAKLRSETALTIDSVAATAVSGRVYPVVVDKSGYLAVTVPWTDENTGITSIPVATSSTIGGVKSGGDITIASTGIVSVNKASQSVAGLMSAADKKKLDGIAENANNYTYTLPTASSSTLGGVKSGSTISSTSGLTACPIISGIPYYKEGVASLSSLGITATATELNYTDGVTSNIQTQLDNKADASHTHDYLPLSGGALRGRTYSSVDVVIDSASFRNIAIIAPGTSVTPGITAIPTGTIWMRYEN